jgi:YidC/Oxa1 family membrane protein insertase
MEPELKIIKKNFPNKEEQAKKTFELYKKYGTNPFSGCLIALIQFPVIIALYYVFRKGLLFDPSFLYSFVHMPAHLHIKFLGLIDVHSKSIVLAFLAGASQFIQGYLATPIKPKVEIVTKEQMDEPKTFQDQLSDSMQMNIRYILPIFITIIAYQISAAVALYWITSNTFTIVQEWYIRRQLSQN